MSKINLTDKNNMICKHCRYFVPMELTKTKIVNPYGYCFKKDIQPKSQDTCNSFIYSDSMVVSPAIPNANGKCFCKRCNHILTDSDSIAKGFGSHCYSLYMKEIKKLGKRLF